MRHRSGKRWLNNYLPRLKYFVRACLCVWLRGKQLQLYRGLAPSSSVYILLEEPSKKSLGDDRNHANNHR